MSFLTASISPIGAVSLFPFVGFAGAAIPRDTRSASARLSSRLSTLRLSLALASFTLRSYSSKGSSLKHLIFLNMDITSRISAGLSLGFLASILRIAVSSSPVTLGLASDGGAAASPMCFLSRSEGLIPAKGGTPVAISKRVTPRL